MTGQAGSRQRQPQGGARARRDSQAKAAKVDIPSQVSSLDELLELLREIQETLQAAGYVER